MLVQPINMDDISFKSLYFTKTGNVLFNPYAKFIQKDGIKVSKRGYKYIEDSTISPKIKERFLNNSFIRDLAAKNDLFIWYREVSDIKGQDRKPGYISMAKIIWSDIKSQFAQEQLIMGDSFVSQAKATESMFNKLNNGIFEKL